MVSATCLNGRGEAFVDIGHCSIHCRLLDGDTTQLNVVISEKGYDLLGDHVLTKYHVEHWIRDHFAYLCEAML